MGSFNPYHVWLELNESITSPNHFQLLGLDESEQDSKVIAAAADRTASKVRRCRPGEHATSWAALLDQIAEAKRCLTDAQQRFKYRSALGLSGTSDQGEQLANVQAGASSRVDPNMYPPGLAPAMTSASHRTSADVDKSRAAGSFDKAWSPPEPIAATSAHQTNPPPSLPPFQPIASPYTSPGGNSNEAMQPYGAAGLSMSPAGVPFLQPADPSSPPDPMYPAVPGLGYGSVSPAMAPIPNYSAMSPLPMHPDPMAALPVAAPPGIANPGPMSLNPMAPQAMAPHPMAAMQVGVPASSLPAAQPLPLGTQPYPMAKPIPMVPAHPAAPVGESTLAVRNSSAILLAQRNQSSGLGLLLGLAAGLMILSVGGAYFYFTSSSNKATEEIASGDPAVDSSASSQNQAANNSAADSENTAGAPTATSFDNDLSQALDGARSANGSTKVPPTRMPTEPATAMVNGNNSETAKPLDSPKPELNKPSEPATPTETPKPDPKPAMDANTKTLATETPAVTDVIPKPTKEDLTKLGRAMTKARDAISEHDFDRADAFIAVASEMPRMSEHQEMLDRLKLLSESVKSYRNAIQTSISKLSSGSSFNVGEAAVGVVETGPDKVIFRVNGQNRSYNIQDLPVGLAAALAGQTLADNDPNTLTLKGAYVMANPRATPEDLKKAREFLEKGAESVDAAKELLLLFDDKYELTK